MQAAGQNDHNKCMPESTYHQLDEFILQLLGIIRHRGQNRGHRLQRASVVDGAVRNFGRFVIFNAGAAKPGQFRPPKKRSAGVHLVAAAAVVIVVVGVSFQRGVVEEAKNAGVFVRKWSMKPGKPLRR